MAITMAAWNLVVALLFANCRAQHLFKDSIRLQDIVSSYCPHARLCHSPAKLKTNGSGAFSCCAPCSCDVDCSSFSNCCPDTTINEKSSSVFECKSTMTKSFNSTHIVLSDVDNGKYWVLATCPSSEVNETLVQKCSGKSKESLTDYVWVSDKKTGRIYQNRYCAMCHRVNEYTSWLIRTRCPAVMREQDIPVAKLLTGECDIINEVPKSEDSGSEIFSCHNDSYSKCNITGLWASHDESIERACKEIQWPFFHVSPHAGLSQAYRNVFCYICNQPDGVTAPANDCKNLDKDGTRTDAMGYSVLLRSVDYIDSHQTDGCREHEVWDTYVGICRRLFCPFGKRPSHGQCINIALSTTGLSVGVYFSLEVLWNQTSILETYLNSTNLNTVGRKIYNKAGKALGFKTTGCFECSGEVLLPPGQSDSWNSFFLSLVYYTIDNCSLDFIIETAMQLMGKQLSISLGANGDMSFNISRNDFYTNDNLYQYAYFKSRRIFCVPSVILSEIKRCPEINISLAEFGHVTDANRRKIVPSLFGSSEYAMNASTSICLVDYFDIMSQTSGQGSVFHTRTIAWRLFNLACIIQILHPFYK